MYLRYYKEVMLAVDPQKTTLSKKLALFVFVPLFLVAAIFGLVKMNEHEALAHPKGLLFPLAGGAGTFSNDFDSPRPGGPHHATDIIAPKMTQIVAAVAGTIRYVPITQPSWGYMISIEDAEGFTYDYIHINNDTPGTDDGNGGPMNAYAPDMKQGYPVAKGQFLGYVGDSGNAENTVSHLHFEITAPDGSKVNPYPYLLEAQRIGAPVTYPALPSEILPYGPSASVTVSMEVGKFEASGTNQLVTAAGPGGGPHVRMLRSNGEIGGFFAYDPGFRGGVNVAAGDVDGDGVDEVITGTASGSPHVRIVKVDGTEVGGFYAYSPSFTGGVNVGAVDVNGDGKDEVVVGPGPGGGPHVRVLKPDGIEVTSFYAYRSDIQSGVDVSGGDVTGTTAKEVVTSPGAGASAHIRIFNSAGQPIGDGFNAYGGFTGGARVSVGNARASSAKDEILVGPWTNGGPHFRLLTYDGSVVSEGLSFDSWWTGKYDVAAGNGVSYVSTGFNRRSSVRPGPH